ncbi:MAG TPA: hypothetical protein VMF03_12370 [Steroidobacteraceae bacterium]|nr:hypothetical protein [Steroidobacteraceae bacterium]
MTPHKFSGAPARRAPPLGAVLVSILGVAGFAGCVTAQQEVSQREDNLAAAGFIVKPANTPERQAMLDKLPSHTFVKRIHGDVVHYVYADPLVCDCLYVGSQQAYGAYQRYMQQKNLADEQQTTAQMFSDPAWNWGAWGPWGPGYGPYFGGVFGW